MILEEYDEANTLRIIARDAREEGRAEGIEIGEKKGIEIGKLKTLIGLVKKNLLSITSAAQEANMTEAEFSELPDMKNA